MGGVFETSDSHASSDHKPIRVPVRRESIWAAAVELAGELDGWKTVSSDEENRVLVCSKKGGMMAGTATITITVEGLEEVPSTTVHAKSETKGGVMARDKAIVGEFIRILYRRIC
ncbi:MAG: carbon monoxide dehydrogenase subunit G [Planctomycetota bacterium]|jgi:carbon monoxide dehydrogenase subunit G